jgi:hypothetical protein
MCLKLERAVNGQRLALRHQACLYALCLIYASTCVCSVESCNIDHSMTCPSAVPASRAAALNRVAWLTFPHVAITTISMGLGGM